MTTVKRKLATILATDCVGFSKHMETDEESTLASLNALPHHYRLAYQ